eukprot:gene4658-4851_t
MPPIRALAPRTLLPPPPPDHSSPIGLHQPLPHWYWMCPNHTPGCSAGAPPGAAPGMLGGDPAGPCGFGDRGCLYFERITDSRRAEEWEARMESEAMDMEAEYLDAASTLVDEACNGLCRAAHLELSRGVGARVKQLRALQEGAAKLRHGATPQLLNPPRPEQGDVAHVAGRAGSSATITDMLVDLGRATEDGTVDTVFTASFGDNCVQ